METSRKQLHVVAFGAHPVDMEIACGATLAKFVKMGHKATLVHLTLGERGNPNLSMAKYAEQKKVEVREAAEVLGCDVRVFPYHDAELPVNDEVQFMVCDTIRELKPDIVITHWEGSFHRDHLATNINVIRGVSWAGLSSMERKLPAHKVGQLYFTDNWEDAEGFVPEIYVEISNVFDQWVEAITRHQLVRGGVSPFPYLEYYKALATIRGAEVRIPKAEAFMRRPLSRRALVDLLPNY